MANSIFGKTRAKRRFDTANKTPELPKTKAARSAGDLVMVPIRIEWKEELKIVAYPKAISIRLSKDKASFFQFVSRENGEL